MNFESIVQDFITDHFNYIRKDLKTLRGPKYLPSIDFRSITLTCPQFFLWIYIAVANALEEKILHE
jgi:hypothetical protein